MTANASHLARSLEALWSRVPPRRAYGDLSLQSVRYAWDSWSSRYPPEVPLIQFIAVAGDQQHVCLMPLNTLQAPDVFHLAQVPVGVGDELAENGVDRPLGVAVAAGLL